MKLFFSAIMEPLILYLEEEEQRKRTLDSFSLSSGLSDPKWSSTVSQPPSVVHRPAIPASPRVFLGSEIHSPHPYAHSSTAL